MGAHFHSDQAGIIVTDHKRESLHVLVMALLDEYKPFTDLPEWEGDGEAGSLLQ